MSAHVSAETILRKTNSCGMDKKRNKLVSSFRELVNLKLIDFP